MTNVIEDYNERNGFSVPRILRTVLPRIRRSITERGVLVSLRRSVLLPFHLVSEYREARRLSPTTQPNEFDLAHGVDTEGTHDGWTFLSDLEIPSANWIHGNNYTPIEPERFAFVMDMLPLHHPDFTFIDFGSGKGRALLLASRYPFRRVIGIEFAHQLHAIAQKNLSTYPRRLMVCPEVESVCQDFLEFTLPLQPLVLFFFDPCSEVVFGRLLQKIRASTLAHPRPLFLIYVAPARKAALLDAADFLLKLARNDDLDFLVYRNC